MSNKWEATFHPYPGPHMCAQTIPGPSWYDQNDPCEYEAVPGADYCPQHLGEERDIDAALKEWKETR